MAQTQQAAPDEAEKPVSKWDSAVDDLAKEQTQGLKSAMFVGAQKNPDHYAKVVEMSKRMSLPPEMIEPEFDKLSKEQLFTPIDGIIKETPNTAKWLSDFNNAAIAHDDIDTLRNIESTVKEHNTFTNAVKGFVSGVNREFANMFSGVSYMYDVVTPDIEPTNLPQVPDERGMVKAKVQMPDGSLKEIKDGELVTPEKQKSFHQKFSEGIRNNAVTESLRGVSKEYSPPEMSESMAKLLEAGDFEGAARVAFVQFSNNMPTQMLMLGGAFLNPAIGMALPGLTTAGGEYTEYLEQGVDKKTAMLGAAMKGGAEVLFEKYGTLGYFKKWESLIAAQYGKGVSREFFNALSKNFLANVGGEAVEEILTEGAQSLTDHLLGTDPNALNGLFYKMADAGILGGLSGGAMTAPAGIAAGMAKAEGTIDPNIEGQNKIPVDPVKQLEKAQTKRLAQITRDTYVKVGKILEQAKLRIRSPEKMQEAVDTIVQSSGVEKIFIPVQAIDKHFQDGAVKFMQSVGASEAYDLAKEHGGDVEIPFAAWTKHVVGTKEFELLANDVKFDPTKETVNEIAETAAETQAELEQVEREAQIEAHQERISVIETKAEEVGNVIEQRLLAAGQTKENAKMGAILFKQHFKTLGLNNDRDPIEILKTYGVDILGEGQTAQPMGDGQATATMNQNPIPFTPNPGLDPWESGVEERFAQVVSQPDVDQNYDALPGSRVGGVPVISADNAKLLLPEFSDPNTAPALNDAVQGPASAYFDERFNRELNKKSTGPNTVTFTSGGSGAGKTTAIPAAGYGILFKKTDFVVDSNLASFDKAAKMIDAVLASGRGATIVYVHRPIENAVEGIAKRFDETGRSVPPRFVADNTIGAQEVIKRLRERYPDNKQVAFILLDNSGSPNDVRQIEWHEFESLRFVNKYGSVNKARKELLKVAENGLKRVNDRIKRDKELLARQELERRGSEELASGEVSQDRQGVPGEQQGDPGSDRSGNGGRQFNQSAAVQLNPAQNQLSPLGFYSQLQREIEKMDFKSMPAKDLANRIKNIQGLKSDELEFSGINEWLNLRSEEKNQSIWETKYTAPDGKVSVLETSEREDFANANLDYWRNSPAHREGKIEIEKKPRSDGKVTKEQVLEFLQAGGIQLEQAVAGEDFDEPKKPQRTARRNQSDIIRPDDVEWTEEQLDADEIDPDGSIRSESAWSNAKEDWDYNRDQYEEEIAEIEKKTREDYPNLDDAQIEAKVKDKFIEKRSDELYEYETEQMDSGNSIYSEIKFISNVEDADVYIQYNPESGGDATLYYDGRAKAHGDPNELKARAIELMMEDGYVSSKPRPATAADRIQWQETQDTDEDGVTTITSNATIEFEEGDDSTITITGDVERGFDVEIDGPAESYLDDRLGDDTLERTKQNVIDALNEEGLLLEPSEQLPLTPEAAAEPPPSINRPTSRASYSEYTLKGGENYRIFKLKLPNLKDPITGEKTDDFTGGHFENNVLVHFRVKTRTTQDGKKVLFGEEFQADWHQKGQESGYQRDVSPEDKKRAEELREQASLLDDQANAVRASELDEAIEKHADAFLEKNKEHLEQIAESEKKISKLQSDLEALKVEEEKARKDWKEADEKEEAALKKTKDADIKIDKAVEKALKSFNDNSIEYRVSSSTTSYLDDNKKIDSKLVEHVIAKTKELSYRLKDGEFEKLSSAIKDLFASKAFTAKLKSYLNHNAKQAPLTIARIDANEKLRSIQTKQPETSDLIRQYKDNINSIKRYKIQDIEVFLRNNNLVDRSRSRAMDEKRDALYDEARKLSGEGSVPNAPWKTSSQWFGLALKRMIMIAKEEGYDMVAWAPGKVHVDRYNQARYLESISYKKDGDRYLIYGKTLNGREIPEQGPFDANALAGAVGKSIAEKIIAGEGADATAEDIQNPEGVKTFKDKDLKVGDLGHIELYDTIFRNAARDVLKKIDKNAKLTVKNATEVFGEPLEETPHSMRNKDDNHQYNEFWAIDMTETLKQKAQEGFTLFQNQNQPRGQITFLPNKKVTIELFKTADFSTFLHEAGHLFLEIMGDFAQDPNSTQQVKDDYAKVLSWLGVESRDQITTEHHEQWARGFEAYLMEGKAPTPALRSIFARFRMWLINVYKDIKNLNVEISDDIRRVMDRMLATQEELDMAAQELKSEPMFDMSTVPPGEQERYAKAIEAARVYAEDQLTIRMMDAYLKEREQAYKDKRKEVRAQVEAEVNQSKLYRAIAIMQKGELPDGSPLPEGVVQVKLDRNIVMETYGKDWVQNLPARILAPKGTEGVHPDWAAGVFGFDNGNDLLNQLHFAEKKSEHIDRLTDEKMKQLFPDEMADPEKVSQAAMDALHNDMKSEQLKLEMEYLLSEELPAFKAGIVEMAKLPRRAVDLQQIREQARAIVAKKQIKDLSPVVYQRAEAKAAKEAGKAYKKGDLAAAFAAKKRQLMAHELYKETVKAREDINKSIKRFKRIMKADEKLAKTREMDLVNAARAILARVGLGKTEKTAEEYLEQTRHYDPDSYEVMVALVQAVPQARLPFKELSVDDFTTVKDSVFALWELSGATKEMEIDGKRVTKEEAIEALESRLEQVTAADNKEVYEQATTRLERWKHNFLGGLAALRRVESWADAMDGGNINGAFKTYIVRPIMDATVRYRKEKNVYLKKIIDIIKPIAPTLTDNKIRSDELKYIFTKSELLGALLHTGNESNFSKLLRGYKWGEVDAAGNLDTSRWDAFIQRMWNEGVLTKADYDFIQSVWDLNEELKPKAQRAHKKMYGYYFSEITAKEVRTPFGIYRGGYVPAVVDPLKVQDAQGRAEQEALTKSNNSFMFPTSGRGFTKKRVDAYAAKLALDLRFLPSHIDKVLRFVHIEPHVKMVGRIVMDKGFRRKLDVFNPAAGGDMLVPWLQRTAQQKISHPTMGLGGRVFDTVFKELRSRTGLNIMVANVTNTLQQFTGLSLAAVKVKPRYLRNALWSYVKAPKELTDWVVSKSPAMETRVTNQAFEMQQHIEDLIVNPNKYEKLTDFMKKNGYFLQVGAQNVVDIVVWTGAYEEAVAKGLPEVDAVRIADEAVRLTQGSFNPEDVSRFETGSHFQRAFTHFYSYFNMWANLDATEYIKTVRELGLRKGAGRLLYIYLFGFLNIAVASEMIVKLMSGDFDEDDDDNYMDDFLNLFFMSHVRSIAAMIPGGQALTATVNVWNSKPYDDKISVSPSISMIEGTVRAPYSVYKAIVDDGSGKRAARDTLTALGMLTGLPVLPLARPVGYLIDVKEDKAQPTGPIDFTRGLITGKPGATP
jgi:hypothetical protein